MSNNQPSPYSQHGSERHDALDLHAELSRIHTEIGKVEHDALIAKARLVNRANEILNKLGGV